MTIDTVLFDLDETLIEYNHPSEELIDRTYEELGIEPVFSGHEYKTRFSDFLDESTDIDDLRERCFRALLEERGHDPELGRQMAQTFARLRDPADVCFRDDARDVLDTLSQDHSLGIVTNGPPEMQRPKIRAVGLDDWVDTAVCAGFEMPPKPDPAPFERALADLDSAAGETVMIGNSLYSDVAGAIAAGLISVWIPSYEEPLEDISPDYTVASIVDIIPPVWVD